MWQLALKPHQSTTGTEWEFDLDQTNSCEGGRTQAFWKERKYCDLGWAL